MLNKLNDYWENTNWEFLMFLTAMILPAVGVIAHCAVNISQGRAFETYHLIVMDHPILTNLGATYLEVLVGDALALLALFIGLYLRYRHYSDERDFMRKYNIRGSTGFSRDYKASGASPNQHCASDNHYDGSSD